MMKSLNYQGNSILSEIYMKFLFYSDWIVS